MDTQFAASKGHAHLYVWGHFSAQISSTLLEIRVENVVIHLMVRNFDYDPD